MRQRLIDANKLPEVDTIERIDGEREVFVNSWVPAMAIWKAPTVEAVPVEWLKQWEEKHKNDPCYCGFVSEEIIKDWEKENADV